MAQPIAVVNEQLTTLQKLMNTAIEFCVRYGFQVIGAMIILILGLAAANWIAGLFLRFLETKKLDITLSRFLAGIVRIIVLGFAVLIALGKFGITITPFIAALSAMAFGTSIALQGPLSNYGAGLSIIFGRPFVVGDTIRVAGVSGLVEEVKLACTILTDEDGVKVSIPNKDIVGQILHNSREIRVVEGTVGISYSDDPEKAAQVIMKIIMSFPEVVKSPAPQVGIDTFADSSINLGYRYWVPTAKRRHVRAAVNLGIFKSFQKEGLHIPFPQREIHILSQPKA